MCLVAIGIQTQTNRKFIDRFLEIFNARIANSPQIEIFGQILFCFLNTTIDVI